MKIYKTVTIPAVPAQPETQEKKVVGLSCDLCDEQTGPSREWIESRHEVEHVEVSYDSGSIRDGGPGVKTIQYHICPACFVTKLIPWMNSQGASPTESTEDY